MVMAPGPMKSDGGTRARGSAQGTSDRAERVGIGQDIENAGETSSVAVHSSTAVAETRCAGSKGRETGHSEARRGDSSTAMRAAPGGKHAGAVG